MRAGRVWFVMMVLISVAAAPLVPEAKAAQRTKEKSVSTPSHAKGKARTKAKTSPKVHKKIEVKKLPVKPPGNAPQAKKQAEPPKASAAPVEKSPGGDRKEQKLVEMRKRLDGSETAAAPFPPCAFPPCLDTILLTPSGKKWVGNDLTVEKARKVAEQPDVQVIPPTHRDWQKHRQEYTIEKWKQR